MTTSTTVRRGKNPYLKTKLMLGAILMLVLALGFNALLTASSLKKLYIESLAASYRVVAKGFQQKIQKSLSYGKNLHKFVGIDQVLESTLKSMALQDEEGAVPQTERRFTALTLPDGTVLYASDARHVGRRLPITTLLAQDEESSAARQSSHVQDGGSYLVALPVTDRGGKIAAAVVIAFDQSQVQTLLNAALNDSIRTGLIAIAIGALLLYASFYLLLPRERARIRQWVGRTAGGKPQNQPHVFPRRHLSAALLLMIILCQGAFSYFSAEAFRQYYLRINREKVVTLNTLLRRDIEFLLDKGLRLDRLLKMEVMMGEILTALPEVSDISIIDADGRVLYRADHEGTVGGQVRTGSVSLTQESLAANSDYNVQLVLRQEGRPIGRLSTNISPKVIDAKLREIILDALTVLVISLLFSVELLMMIFQFLDKQAAATGQAPDAQYAVMRPAAFLFLFGIDISISFLPLHMGKLFKPLWGLSRDVVLGLPISTEMFFVMISLYVSGVWLDRRGWREPFLWGLVLSGCGVLYSWLAPDALNFILSRAVVGLGYGFTLMASQGFVIAHSDARSKAQGLAALFAGVYAGSICGGAAGGMLAERIGYHPVFFLGALIVFLVIGYTLLLIRVPSTAHTPAPVPASTPAAASKPILPSTRPAPRGRQVIRFLFNRDIFSLLLLSSLPSAIALVGFLNYFCPVYLNRIGASQSNIGRVFMIYGICLIVIAPYVSRYIDAADSKKRFIVLGGLLGGLGFLGFYFLSGYGAVAAAVFVLGLSGSFNQSRSAYALKLKVTRELGPGKAIGLFNAASRIGQVIGPFLFGWMLLTVGGTQMMVWFGILYLSVTLFFLLVARNDRHMA